MANQPEERTLDEKKIGLGHFTWAVIILLVGYAAGIVSAIGEDKFYLTKQPARNARISSNREMTKRGDLPSIIL